MFSLLNLSEKLWEKYNDTHFENPYGKTAKDKEEFMKSACIVSCQDTGLIISGRGFQDLGKTYDYEPLHYVGASIYSLTFKMYGPSRHYTVLFNLFVFLQLFNFLNARKIEDECNIFENILGSSMFIGIVLLILLL